MTSVGVWHTPYWAFHPFLSSYILTESNELTGLGQEPFLLRHLHLCVFFLLGCVDKGKFHFFSHHLCLSRECGWRMDRSMFPLHFES